MVKRKLIEPKTIFDYLLIMLVICIGAGILIFAVIFGVTRDAINIPIIGKLVFSETGPIGDTIGGISAPIVGVVAGALTFLAFYMQYLANKSLNGAEEKRRIQDGIKEHYTVLSSIKLYDHEYGPTGVIYKGGSKEIVLNYAKYDPFLREGSEALWALYNKFYLQEITNGNDKEAYGIYLYKMGYLFLHYLMHYVNILNDIDKSELSQSEKDNIAKSFILGLPISEKIQLFVFMEYGQNDGVKFDFNDALRLIKKYNALMGIGVQKFRHSELLKNSQSKYGIA